jgi:hypothetical protein
MDFPLHVHLSLSVFEYVEYGGQKLVLLLVRGALDRCCDVAIWTAVAQHGLVVMLVVLGFGVTDSGNTNRVVRKAWRRRCRSGGPRRRWRGFSSWAAGAGRRYERAFWSGYLGGR